MEINRLVVSKLTQEIWQILTWTLKSLKHFRFNGLLLIKVFIFWAKNVQISIFYDTEEWCKIWRKTVLWFEKWHEKFGKFSPEHSRVLKVGLWWDPSVQSMLSRCYLKTFLRSYVSWKWRLMQSLKSNWLVVLKLVWGSSRILTRALKSLKNNGLLPAQKN